MQDIIDLYNQRLQAKHYELNIHVDLWEGYFAHDADHSEVTSLVLKCWTIDPKNLPTGFSNRTTKANMTLGHAAKYQYDLRSDARVGRRILAWKVSFLGDPNFDNDDYTVSHLCHNENCYRTSHHMFEPLWVNKGRNGCPGGSHCHHIIKCRRPGPYYDC